MYRVAGLDKSLTHTENVLYVYEPALEAVTVADLD